MSDSQEVSLQDRVSKWLRACFGPEIARDKAERCHRFLEEALELGQACGVPSEDAIQLVRYVYGRETGDPEQEVGGVALTLAALCSAHGFSMEDSAERELDRVWRNVEKIRPKQAAKPKGSPLPQAIP